MKSMGLLFCCFLICSCTNRITDFTVISTKNVNLANVGGLSKGERVQGIDKTRIIVIIPTGTPNLKEAIDQAIESTPNCVGLADGVVYHTGWYIPYIYGEQYYTVEGTTLLELGN